MDERTNTKTTAMKQTSIEWLWFETFEEDSIRNCFPPSKLKEIKEKYQQAKQMHKQEIEDAYYDGQSLNAKSVTSQMIIDNAMSYYNEIYGGNK